MAFEQEIGLTWANKIRYRRVVKVLDDRFSAYKIKVTRPAIATVQINSFTANFRLDAPTRSELKGLFRKLRNFDRMQENGSVPADFYSVCHCMDYHTKGTCDDYSMGDPRFI